MSKWAAERKISMLKTSHIQCKKCWMSWRLWKHREFTAEEERELFRLSFLTARKWHASTQSESESETSTKRFIRRFNNKESLFDMLTESSNMTMMNLFQQEQDESLRHQDESLKLQKDSKSK